jgi:hypothetical protein
MINVRRRSSLFKALISCVVVAAGLSVPTAAHATGTAPTGVLEICKKASGSGVDGSFAFTVSGVTGSISVPVNGCSQPITVKAGQVVITEAARAGFVVADITAAPAANLVSKDLAARTATVTVVAGGAGTQTIATFTNKVTPKGFLEVCKRAPAGDNLAGTFTFTVAASGTTTTVTAPVDGCANAIELPAGQATVTETARAGTELVDIAVAPSGRSVSTSLPNRSATVQIVEGGPGSQTIVTFTNKTTPPPKGSIKVCKIAGAGIALGQTFTFTVGGVTTTAQAGSCSLPIEVAAGDVVVTETAVGGTIVSAITALPSTALVSSNLANRTATVRVTANQVTEVNFTNEKQTGTVKVCKIAGPGVVAGQVFDFTVGTVHTTAAAGSCSLPITLPVGNVTVIETGPAGFDVTAITITGAGSLVSSDLATATAVVGVAVGVTEVNFTNKVKNRPPVCTGVRAAPNSLWPPNHKFQTVTLSGATDPDGDAITLTITGVTQDEALNGTGDGDTAPDAATVAGRSDQVQLRAERSGSGDGRVYRIAFTVSDGKLTCSGTVFVGVPHDQSGSPAVDTTSVVVNSFGP